MKDVGQELKSLYRKNYSENMKVLKPRYPELAKRVEWARDSGKYKVFLNNGGTSFNLMLNETGKTYYSQENQKDSVKREMDELKLHNTKLALFLGFGLGYELMHYVNDLLEEQRTGSILIVEKEVEIFALAIHVLDFSDVFRNKNVHLIIGESEESLFHKFNDIFTDNINYITFMTALNPIYHSSSMEINKEYYLNAIRSLKEALKYKLKWLGNSPEDSLIGLRHMFNNLNTIIESPGIKLIFDKFKNKPAVVVASGPSLKKNMHLLSEIKDRAIIICAQSTLKILLENGIKPHIVASLERDEGTPLSFEGLESEIVQNIYLAACPVVPKETYEVYSGPNLIVYREFAHFTWLELEKGMLNIKQSSANMAFKVAVALGSNPITLIGQDLAFDKDTKATHMDAHILGNNQDKYHEETLEVKSIDGGKVLTSDTWYSFLKSFEVDVADYNGKCIDATEGGAFIQGTEVMTFQESIRKYMEKEIYPLEIIEKSTSKFLIKDKGLDRERIAKKIDLAIEDIEKILDYCHEGIDFSDEKYGELEGYTKQEDLSESDKKSIQEIYSKIFEYKEKVKAPTDTFRQLIMHIVQSIFLKFEMDMNGIYSGYKDYDRGLIDVIIRHRDWFVKMNNLSILVQDELKKAKVDIEKVNHKRN